MPLLFGHFPLGVSSIPASLVPIRTYIPLFSFQNIRIGINLAFSHQFKSPDHFAARGRPVILEQCPMASREMDLDASLISKSCPHCGTVRW
jgi:hypothetical protein